MYQLALAALLQLSLFSLAEAAPISAQSNSWQYGTGGGIIGFIVLILDIIVFSTCLCPFLLFPPGVQHQ